MKAEAKRLAVSAPDENWTRWIQALPRGHAPHRVKMVVTLDLTFQDALLLAGAASQGGVSVPQVLEAVIIESDRLLSWSDGDRLDLLKSYAEPAGKAVAV